MHRWTSLDQLPAPDQAAVVSIGNFDGVHTGHQAVLAHAQKVAEKTSARSVVVTFSPHPMQVLNPDSAPLELTTMSDRLDLLADQGVDEVLVLPFTRDVAAWSPEHFVHQVLVSGLGATTVVVGEDFRFGARGVGNPSTLRALGNRWNFSVIAVEDVLDQDRRWSSTWARELVTAGDMRGVAKVLGRPHRVVGTVVHGNHRGRELGYPTANIAAECLVPADGIYAGWLTQSALAPEHPDYRLPAAISLGTNPTFNGVEQRCEAYVLDRTDLDLYGQHVAVEFTQRLRGTVKFAGIDELLTQMALDVAQCRELLTSSPSIHQG